MCQNTRPRPLFTRACSQGGGELVSPLRPLDGQGASKHQRKSTLRARGSEAVASNMADVHTLKQGCASPVQRSVGHDESNGNVVDSCSI